MQTLLDLVALRTFVVGVKLGTFNQAAAKLGRSNSAISSQIKKLEQQLGQTLFEKSGRCLSLNPQGELLFSYAQRLLDLNDEAVLALQQQQSQQVVRIGIQEDFGSGFLSSVLGKYQRALPNVQVNVRLQRNAELISAVEKGELDFAVIWALNPSAFHAETLGEFPLRWIGSAVQTSVLKPDAKVDMVVFDEPCHMQKIGLDMLNREQQAWHINCSSISLNGIWEAVGAGLGVTVRTAVGVPAHLKFLPSPQPLPMVSLQFYGMGQHDGAAIATLKQLIRERVVDLPR
ncbi:LysR substrate-binding domain-containing protein [Vitreoscilla massiliensis]|uniref:LysR substrate-binding domain-containing protein n=1 Tax=Vitreoscilla massiliensis TaxID=1689272 RepID=A0ABY4E2P7_9NEIS|nr:LysR substrate-binding domain-containing protein [Vitreoscilla massiliensis]UOO88593.1 LysR substrate-binding domain-containing protein [Vitreoscilla massiliensis]